MKITNREKILLIVLGSLILLIGYYQFILSPQLNRIKELRVQSQEYSDKVNKVKIEISPDNKVHKEYKVMNTKIALATDNLFPKIIQEKFIVILDEMAKKSGVDAQNISFTEEEVDIIGDERSSVESKSFLLKRLVQDYNGEAENDGDNQKEPQKKDNTKEDTSKKSNEAQLEKMSTTISFSGRYEDIISLLRDIETYDKNILIKDLTLNNSDGEPMTGNIVLDFYAVPKLHDQDESFIKWDFNNEYGRENPFKPFIGYVGADNKASSNRRVSYDFFMTVKPITSDLPTVIIGKAKDTSMNTYVFADNPGIEDVEFRILQKDNKYYYKYRTKSESYPQNFNDEGIEFTPIGNNIELYIATHKRNSEADNSGINLSLMNKSDLRLNVRIVHEDKNQPRVKVVNKLGDIVIKRSVEE